MATQNLFGNLVNPLDPSSAVNAYQVQRRLQMAQALQQQALQPLGSDLPQNMPIIPTVGIGNGLVKLAQALVARNAMDNADKSAGDLASRNMSAVSDALDPNQSTTPVPATQAAPAALSIGASQGSVGPTVHNAQIMDTMTNPPPTKTGSPLNPIGMNKQLAAYMLMNNPQGYFAAQAQAYKPTDATLLARAAGVDPAQANAAMLNKQTFINPINVREASTLLDPVTRQPFYNAPNKEGIQYTFGPDGKPTAQAVPGFNQALYDFEKSKAAAQGSVIPYSGFDANGNPMPLTNRTAAATQGAAPAVGVPNAGFPAGTQVPSSGIDNTGRLPILQQERDNIAKQPDSPQKASDLAAIEREIARVSGGAQSQPSGAIYGAQAPGVVTGANAAAKNLQNELSKKWTDLSAQNQQAQTANSYLDNIATLAQKAAVGPASDKLNYINGLLSLAGNEKATDARTANDLLSKYSSQIVSRLGQGGLGTDAARTILQAAYPNAHMTGDAIQEAVRNIKGANAMIQAKTRLLASLANARNSQEYNNKEILFDQNADPRIWEYQSISDPAQRQAFARQVLQQDPQFPQKIKTLESLGVLQ